RAGWRILRERLVARLRSAVLARLRYLNGISRAKQVSARFHYLITELTKWCDVVKHPEAATVCADDQIIFVNDEITHGHWRQIELQRLPMVSIIEGNEDAKLRACEEQSASLGVFLHGLHVNALR